MPKTTNNTRTWYTLLAGLSVAACPAFAAPVTLRLVAADRPDRPLCSQPTDFRYSPFGGLIATNWLGGVTVDGRAAFPVQETGSRLPKLPTELQTESRPDDDILAELDDELAAVQGEEKAAEGLTRAADTVDPMYQGKFYPELTHHREIGPNSVRHSQAQVDVGVNSVLQPGDIPLRGGGGHVRVAGGRVEVDCYPVTIRAVRSAPPERRIAAEMKLRWGKVDLLADMRFEHSPALPAGPPAELLDAEGRARLFYDLTVYLLPTLDGDRRSATPYTLNGVAFHLGKNGVVLEGNVQGVRQAGPFTLEVLVPAAAPATGDFLPAIPVYLDARPGITLGQANDGTGTWHPLNRDNPSLTVRHTVGSRSEEIVAKLPKSLREQPNVVAVCRANEQPDADSGLYVFGTTDADATRNGVLRIDAAAWTAKGVQALPERLEMVFEAFPAVVVDDGKSAELPSTSGDFYRLLSTSVDPGDEGKRYGFDVGGVRPGLYRVRFPELFSPAAGYEFFVCVANPGLRGAVTLFTHHNRCDYRQGETIELAAVLRAVQPVDGVSARLLLTDGHGAESALAVVDFAAPAGGTDTRFVTIPAGQLQPGRYILRAVVDDGSLIGHGLVLNIFPQELKTTWEGFATTICETGPFRTSEGMVNYRLMQNSPLEALRNPAEQQRYTAQTALPAEFQHLCRLDPLFPAIEATARYDEAEKALAAATRLGVQYMPHGAWGLDGQTANWNPMHSHDESLDWMRRMYALRAQIYREFDSFGGFFMNWYPSLGPHYEMHPPRAGFAEFQSAALQKAVQEAQGPLPEGWTWSKENGLHLTQADGTIVKEAEILAAGVEHPLFNAPAMQQLAEWKLRGTRRRAGAFAEAYSAWTAVPRELGDWNYLSFVPVGWFRSPDYYPPIYYSSQPRVGIHAYTDWQVDPFMELFGIDYYGAGSGRPPWVQAFSGGRNMHIRQTFLAAGRGAWGLGLDARSLVPAGREGEEIRLVAELMHRYGPYFMELKPRSPVAIVRSLHQEAADAGEFRGSGGRNGMIWFAGLQGELWMLYYNLLRSGYPADFITEEEIAAGKLADYQAVFLHRQRLLMPPELMQQFQTYVAAGGRVLRDPSSSPVYPGEEVVVTADPEVKTDVGSSNHVIGGRYLWLLHNYLQCKNRLETVLATLPKPWVRSDSHHIVHTSLAGRDSAALFVINDTMVPPRMHTAAGKWFIQGWTLTREGRLFFDKPYYVYDVTEGGKEARVEPSAPDGYPLDFRRSEGRILIATERPIRNVNLTVRLIRHEGGDKDELRITTAVLDDKGKPFRDPLPFELVLRDPAGREVKRLWRACGPEHPVSLAMGRNLPGGWTIQAQELASGLQTAVTLAVNDTLPFTILNGPVLARRPEEVGRFLHEKKSITILLDEGQSEDYRQAADELAAALRAAGKSCTVLELDPVEVYDLPLRWRRNAYDQAVWEGVTKGELMAVRRGLSTLSDQNWAYYDHPLSGYEQPGPQFAVFRDLVLLGTPENNRLIADLHQAIGQPASAHWPGTDGALIQVIRDGFAPRYDTLTIQAADSKGLAAGSAWLMEAFAAARDNRPAREVEIAAATAGAVVKGVLPNVQRDGFGVPVNGLAPLNGGKQMLVSLSGADLSGCSKFGVDVASGAIVDHYPEILGGLTAMGPQMFLQSWQGRTVFRGRDIAPLWQLRGEGAEGVTVHPETGDIFVGFEGRILRLNRQAETIWVRDLAAEINREHEFLEPCQANVQAVSPDGRHLLVSSYREQMYGNTVAGYVAPAVMLLNTETGAILWRHTGDLVRGTACHFIGDRIVVCNSGDSKDAPIPALTLLDMNGKIERKLPLAAAVARVNRFGGDGLAVIAEVGGTGVGLLNLNTGKRLDFPVAGNVKDAWVVGDTVVIGTWDKGLYRFDTALRPVLSSRLASQANSVIADPAGKGLLVGTDSGQLLWLDAEGEVTRTVDFNDFNLAENDEWWVRRFLGENLADIPEQRIVLWVGRAVSALEQAAKHADLSGNLLAAAEFAKTDQPWQLTATKPVAVDFACTPGTTYVLSLFQKAVVDNAGDLAVELAVEFGGGTKPYRVLLPLSAGWEERTASFRAPPEAAKARLTLSLVGGGKLDTEQRSAWLERVELAAVRFRTRNVLFQKLDTSPKLSLTETGPDDGGLSLDGILGMAPPTVTQVIPWVSHLAKATGAGEKAPTIVTPWTMLVDGKLEDQESSWTGKPLPQGIFCDRAELVVTFKQPRSLSLVALYHDPAAPPRYTSKFALFARTKQGLKLLGSHDNNHSPYTLFVFDPIEVDSLVYYWLGSPDGHVRLMEIEAYGHREEL